MGGLSPTRLLLRHIEAVSYATTDRSSGGGGGGGNSKTSSSLTEGSGCASTSSEQADSFLSTTPEELTKLPNEIGSSDAQEPGSAERFGVASKVGVFRSAPNESISVEISGGGDGGLDSLQLER